MVKNLTILSLMLLTLSTCTEQKTMIDNSVVEKLEIEKYLGQWYEIARFDHSFEKGLVGVTANYSFRKDGKIKVVNSGFNETLDGKRSESIGKAKVPNTAAPSKLKVSFFWFFYGDYFVMELDEDYDWAVIGSSSDKYLWILSRTQKMDEAIYKDLLDRLTKRGYDVTKLIEVEQKDN